MPLVPVDMGALEHKGEAVTARNPLQRLPVLELDDGTVLTESVAICRYFEELHPEPALFGQRRARQGAGRDVAAPHGAQPVHAASPQAFRHIHPAMKEWEVPQVPEWGEANKPKALDFLRSSTRELANREFAAGDAFSIADITGLVAIDFMKPARIAIPEELTNVLRWHQALQGAAERRRLTRARRARRAARRASAPAASASTARSAGRCRTSRARCCVPSSTARILIAGQAPGTKVHAIRHAVHRCLRRPAARLAGRHQRRVLRSATCSPSLPMGFCFPGQDAKGGDLPPRRECAPAWRAPLMARCRRSSWCWRSASMRRPGIWATLRRGSLTETVRDWRAIYDAPTQAARAAAAASVLAQHRLAEAKSVV